MSLKRIDYTYRGKPSHRYELDGVKVPGVTTLIGDGLPKPALLPWGIKSVATYAANNIDALVDMRAQGMSADAITAALKATPYAERDAAAKRGTEVHALGEQLIHGLEVEVPAELSGYVDAYVRFLDEWKPTPIAVEAACGSRRWQYAGTWDIVADLPDGRRVLMDIKTSRSGVYGETALQLAAYAHSEVYLDGEVEKPTADLGITHGYAIWVKADGYQVLPVDISEETFNTFQHVALVARRGKALRDLIGEPEVAA